MTFITAVLLVATRFSLLFLLTPLFAAAQVPLRVRVLFVYGIAVVAPVITVLLLLDVGMAVAARTMPQVNMFIIGFPLKIFLGLMVLALSLNYMGPVLEKIYSSVFFYWQRVIG